MLNGLATKIPGADRDRTYLQKQLKTFTEETHVFTTETKLNCRSDLAPFYHELGKGCQSIMGFLQLTSDSAENFLEEIARNQHFPIRDNHDLLYRLRNISPILYQVYSNLRSDAEEKSFNKIVKGLLNIFKSCFQAEPRWWQKKQDNVTDLDHEKYMVSGRAKVRDLPQYVGSGDSKGCTKKPYSKSNHTGTFFLACCHGFYIAALLMQVCSRHNNKKFCNRKNIDLQPQGDHY